MSVHVLSSVASPANISRTDMANAIRFPAIDAVEKAKSVHSGMPMGMPDVATVLFSQFLKFDPTDLAWPDRDRFVLSAGHGSMLLYALLYLTGHESVERRAYVVIEPEGGRDVTLVATGSEVSIALEAGKALAKITFPRRLFQHRASIYSGSSPVNTGRKFLDMGLAWVSNCEQGQHRPRLPASDDCCIQERRGPEKK